MCRDIIYDVHAFVLEVKFFKLSAGFFKLEATFFKLYVGFFKLKHSFFKLKYSFFKLKHSFFKLKPVFRPMILSCRTCFGIPSCSDEGMLTFVSMTVAREGTSYHILPIFDLLNPKTK